MSRKPLAILLLPLLLVVFFYDVVFLGRTLSTAALLPGATPGGPYGFSGHRPELPFSFDTGGNAWVNEPNPYIIRRELDETCLPKWNPYEGIGMPLIGNLNNEVFNPLKAYLNFTPGPYSQDLFFLLRLLVMGVFTYLFLSEMGLSVLPCLFGSSAFMLSGYSIWWINLHPLSTVMYLPAVFYFYERWSNKGDLKSAFFMSLFLSFSLAAGKIPDVVMGLCLLSLHAVRKGFLNNSIRGLYMEGRKVAVSTVSAVLMAAPALVPFLELHFRASPLAKAIRTGSAGHSVPLLTSVSLVQPLFFNSKNYFYGSWLKWTPEAILPHAGMATLLIVSYAALNGKILKRTLPYFVFSMFLLSAVYGFIPSPVISSVPLFRGIEFLKYNSMLYFSLAVIAACALEDLLSPKSSGKSIYISFAMLSLLMLVYFALLYRKSPSMAHGLMFAVLLISLLGLSILGIAFYIFKNKQMFGMAALLFLLVEMFLYMPRDHPDRYDPYKRPPYLDVLADKEQYRISGGGSSIPPLVSGAAGLYDARAISVLMPGDYYSFFETLMGFSAPGTNNPNPLFTATSPFIDLAGVKYILSDKPLMRSEIEEEVNSQVGAMRLVRLFEAMKSHYIDGEASYGFLSSGGEKRFSLIFPMKFAFETKIRATQPFIASGFMLTGIPKDSTARVKISAGSKVEEVAVREGRWEDAWLDVSNLAGKVITLRIEATNPGSGKIAVGNLGLSPGFEKERNLYNVLLPLHEKEFDYLKYLGEHEGMYVYENSNVMDRAFVLHKIKAAQNLGEAIEELQGGLNFREVALAAPPISPLFLRNSGDGSSGGETYAIDFSRAIPGSSRAVIEKYAPDEIAISVNSGGGLLVLSDLYYPGWKVRVNGREEPMVKAFGLFRAVAIGEGKNDVLFYYRPMSFYLGGAISILTFAAWLAFLAFSRGRTRGA